MKTFFLISLIIETMLFAFSAADASAVQPQPADSSAPRLFSHFTALNPGSIKPQGWLDSYTRIIADGWPLRYAQDTETSSVLYSTFWNRNNWCVDYPGYFADGFIRLSHTEPDSQLAKEFAPWLKQLLAAQEEDGYLGPLDPPSRWRAGLDVFSQCLAVHGLIYHYKRTGDKEALAVAKKSADRFVRAFYQPESEVSNALFANHGTYCVRPLKELYALTGDQRYRDAIIAIVTKYQKVGNVLGNHDVEQSEHAGIPIIAYEVSGDESYLKTNLDLWQRLQEFITIAGLTTGNEGITKKKPRAISEHCGAVEWLISNEDLLRVTGEVRFADAVEKAFYNAYPATKSADTLTLGYMHSPNQLAANEWSHPHWEDYDELSREYYSSAHGPLCCNVMSPRCPPYFIDNAVMQTKQALAVVHYAPVRAVATLPNVGQVEIVQETIYPFEDDVKIIINPRRKAEFTMMFRIPGWCSSATFDLNGQPLNVAAQPGQFANVLRTWNPGDVVKVRMQIPLRLDLFAESTVRVGGAAVVRGPLAFTLPVDENWVAFTSPVNSPGKNPLSFRLSPKPGAVWNYAMIVNQENLEESFKLVRLDDVPSGNPWQRPVLGLEVQARRVIGWEKELSLDWPMTPGLPQKSMAHSETKEKITLVPFGNTHLRMTYLPLAKP